MSWGERSCVKPCRIPYECSMEICNTKCREYIWDGVTAKEPRGMIITEPHKSIFTGRNHPCKCGSGKKLKFCCEKKR